MLSTLATSLYPNARRVVLVALVRSGDVRTLRRLHDRIGLREDGPAPLPTMMTTQETTA